MNFRLALLLPATYLLTASASQSTQEIVVTKAGSQPPVVALSEHFTGTAHVHSRFQATEPGRVRGAVVTFEPGARTNWHKHPLGQTLIITDGVGWVQHWNGLIQEMRPGDVVWIPPGVKHWHGATATDGMSHIAIGEMLDGKTVEWLEPVTHEQYDR